MSMIGKTHSIATRDKISAKMTKFKTADLIEKTKAYIDNCKADPNKLPSLADLALFAGVNKSLIPDRALENPDLAELIKMIETMQEAYLLNKGDKTERPTFQIFLLKTRHAYKESAPNLTQNNNFNISPDLLADAIELMNKKKTPD